MNNNKGTPVITGVLRFDFDVFGSVAQYQYPRPVT